MATLWPRKLCFSSLGSGEENWTNRASACLKQKGDLGGGTLLDHSHNPAGSPSSTSPTQDLKHHVGNDLYTSTSVCTCPNRCDCCDKRCFVIIQRDTRRGKTANVWGLPHANLRRSQDSVSEHSKPVQVLLQKGLYCCSRPVGFSQIHTFLHVMSPKLCMCE